MRHYPCLATTLLLACVLLSGASGSLAATDDATGLVVGPTVRAPFLDDHYAVTLAILEDGAFALSGTTTIPTQTVQGGYPQFEVQLYAPTDGLLGSFVPRPPATTGGLGSLGTHYRAPVLVAQDHLAAEGFHFEMNPSGRGLVTWTTFDSNGIFTGHYKHLDVAGSISTTAERLASDCRPVRNQAVAASTGSGRE